MRRPDSYSKLKQYIISVGRRYYYGTLYRWEDVIIMVHYIGGKTLLLWFIFQTNKISLQCTTKRRKKKNHSK